VTAVVLLAFGGTVLWLWRDAEVANRQADEARKTLANIERSRRREQAQAATDSVMAQLPDLRRRALWPQALGLLSQTKALVDAAAPLENDQLELAECDIRLLAELDGIRMRKAMLAASNPEDVWNGDGISNAYKDAFRNAGYFFSRHDSEGAISATVKKLTESPIKDDLIVALDDWAWSMKGDDAEAIWQTTTDVTGRKWRTQLQPATLSAHQALMLSGEVPMAEMTPAIVCGLGLTMRFAYEGKEQLYAIRWLEAGAKQYPADFWINFYLGIEYRRLKDWESAAGAFRAAAAVRPDASLPRECLDQCLQEIERGRIAEKLTK
jgi:tetratricopeptide (TPR) repeat protein